MYFKINIFDKQGGSIMEPESWGGFKKDLTGHLDLHLEWHHRKFLKHYEKHFRYYHKSKQEMDFKEFQRLLKLKSWNPVNRFFNGSNGSGMIHINLNGSSFKIPDDPKILTKIKMNMNKRWINKKQQTKKMKGETMTKKADKGKTEMVKDPKQDPKDQKTEDPKPEQDPKIPEDPKDQKTEDPKGEKSAKPAPKKSAKKGSGKKPTGKKPESKPSGKEPAKKDDKPKKITAVDVAKMVNKNAKKMTLKKVKGLIPDYKFHLHKNQWVATFFRHVEPKHHEKYIALKPAPKKTKGKEGADNGKEESKSTDNPPGGQDPKT